MEKDIKGLILYIPTTIYIIIFSFLMIGGFASNNIPSLFNILLYIGLPQSLNISAVLVPLLQFGILFEFLFVSIFLYLVIKIILKNIPPFREDLIFPNLLVFGYILWAFPIINHTIPCSGRLCQFLSLYPLSYVSIVIQKVFPKFSFEVQLISGLIIIILILHYSLSFIYKQRKTP